MRDVSLTPNLALPYIMAAQAQKHVTHNEALRALDCLIQLSVLDRDLASPPSSADNGARYIVAASPTGAWAGRTNDIAAYQDGAWAFFTPEEGWISWVADEDLALAWDGSTWIDITGTSLSINPTPLVGVNATADTTNRLSVSSAASLFNHDGAGHQQKINKNAAVDTASQLYQTNFSGRAEIGLTGDDNFHFKVSADGSSFVDALILDKTTGAVTHKAGARSTFAHDATNAGLNVVPVAGDPSSPTNGDIWYNATSGKFRKRQAGATSDLDTSGGGSTAMPTVQAFTSSGTWTKPSGCLRIRVRMVGGGGGGAGATAAGSACCCGSGGQAGGYAEGVFDVTGTSSEAVTIGAAGTAGAAANGAGGNGGTTSLGSLLTAVGGKGGTGLASGSTAACVTSDHTTTSGSGGFVNCAGSPGGPANRESGTVYFSGFGGSSPFGGGGGGRSPNGTGASSGPGAGIAASGYGAGGGAAASTSSSGFTGAAGTAGIVIVEEFY